MNHQIEFVLNGKPVECLVSSETTLLSLLRDQLGLTGTKSGCGEGHCGACSVLVNDHLVKSCQIPALRVAGKNILTIEGIHDPDGGPGELQRAFLQHGATQCGFCTPAMVLAGEAVLRQIQSPSRVEIRTAISPVLCRCTGYQQIVDAIEAVALNRLGHQPKHLDDHFLSQKQTGLQYVGDLTMHAVDGLDKVMGEARYVDDIQFKGILHGKVLRSHLPHARITKLDIRPALEVPGVLAAITSEDFVEHGKFGWPVKDAFILAHDKVRYVGDPIAAVAGETEEAALAGLAAIICDLTPLPVVGDMHRSLDEDTPIVPDNSGFESNLCISHIVRNGDPNPIIAESPVQIDQTYTFQHQDHAYIETEGALALPELDGSVTIYANDQSPYINRDNAAMVLGLPKDKVRIIQPPVGGSFGGKDDIGYQCTAQAARLALITGRPVKIVLGRSESLTASYKREAMDVHLQLGASSDGRLRAVHVDMLADSGAYGSMTPLSAWRGTMHAGGAYRYEAASVDTNVVYTNNGYCGAFRGFGNPQACGSIEIAMDELAAILEKDPIDLRLKNILHHGDRAFTGNPMLFDVTVDKCLNWVREKSDWDQKRKAYSQQPADQEIRKGIGVACYFHGSGLGGEGTDYARANIRIEPDNSITLQHAMTDYGQGSRTVFTLLAAEVLGVSPARIHMLRPDTQTARETGPTVASRATLVGGNAVRVTAEKLKETLCMAGANLLGCSKEELNFYDGFFISPNENEASFDQVVAHARKMGLQLSSEGYWQIPVIHWDFETGTGTPYFTYCYGAQVADVIVNQNSGAIKVEKIWAAHDAGTIVFPLGAKGQMIGGIAQGVGYALTEGFTFKEGYPQKITLKTYTIPDALDTPEVDLSYLDSNQDEGPFGAKGLAEPTMVATAPAIANAVYHATGQRLRDFPLKLEMA